MPSTRFLILAVAGLVAIAGGSRHADAATILVPGDYNSLQAAANGASAGDVILIYKGAVAENVSLTARSDLVFVGKGKPAMKSFSLSQCNRISIQGLQIVGADADGIYLWSSNDIIVQGVTVQNAARDGIQVENCARVRIEACRIEGASRDGIRVGRASGPAYDAAVVKNRIASVAQAGIAVAGSRNLFEKNSVTACGTNGVQIESGADNTFAKNKLAMLGDDGFHVVGAGSNQFLGNSVKAASRVGYYLNCSGNELTGNKAKGSGTFGLMDLAGGNTLTKNSFDWSWIP